VDEQAQRVAENEILFRQVNEHVVGGGRRPAESFEIICDPSDTVRVRQAVQEAGLDYDSAEISFVPEFTQEIDAPTAEKLFKIIEALEDSDDVQNVYSNFDASDEVLASVG